jgi:formylglycine-generating enzyme required for sulfatase activity
MARAKKSKINYGQVIRTDGSIEKKFDADGFYFTNPVKEFPAGRLGLYGMQGNAAEWAAEMFTLHRMPKGDEYLATKKSYNGENMYVIKGGSWNDDSFYLQPCVRQVYPAGKGSPRIGFRIVALDLEELLK